jgi:hypothetical protein
MYLFRNSFGNQQQLQEFVRRGVAFHVESLSYCLLPHPSLPAFFAFTPTKVIIVHPNPDATFPSIGVQQVSAAYSSLGGIWGLTNTLKALVGYAGSR